MVNGEEIVFFKVDLVCVDNENDWMKKRGSPIKLWNSIAIPIPHGPINACFEFDPFLIQVTWLNSKVIIYFFWNEKVASYLLDVSFYTQQKWETNEMILQTWKFTYLAICIVFDYKAIKRKDSDLPG